MPPVYYRCNKVKRRLLLLSIIIFSWFLYKESLSFFFISDDFYFLSLNSFEAIFKTLIADQHFIPVFLSFIYGLKSIFGLNPFVFHLCAVIVHMVNILLVYSLGKLLLLKTKNALLAAFMFAFFYTHYEAVYWISGTSFSLMVFFYLTGLILLLEYMTSRRMPYLWAYMICALLAFSTHEYALSILIFPFLLKQKRAVKSGLVLSLLVLGSIFIRRFLGNMVTPQQFQPVNFLKGIIISHTQLLVPLPQFLERIPDLGVLTLFFLLVYFLLRRPDPKQILLVLWLESTVILFSATSLPQARYYYLSSIPAIFLIISTLGNKSRIAVLAVIISNFLFLNHQKNLWSETGMITRKIVSQISGELRNLPEGKKLYAVNLPDSLNGPPWHAFLFRNGLKEAVELIGKTESERLELGDPFVEDEAKIIKENSLILKYVDGSMVRYPL